MPAIKKYRPQLTMAEIDTVLASLCYTQDTLQAANETVLYGEVTFNDLVKLTKKLELYKYKAELELVAPAYTASHTRSGRPRLDTSATPDVNDTADTATSEDTTPDKTSKEAMLYSRYNSGEELDTRDKVIALEYKTKELGEKMASEEESFYAANFHLTL